MRGHLITYYWPRFLQDFKFGPGMKPMGRTYRISAKAFAQAPVTGEDQYFTYVTQEHPPRSEILVASR